MINTTENSCWESWVVAKVTYYLVNSIPHSTSIYRCQRSALIVLVTKGYNSPWGCKEWDTTEYTHTHTHTTVSSIDMVPVLTEPSFIIDFTKSRWEKAFYLSFSFPIRDSKENLFWFHRFNTKGITTNYVEKDNVIHWRK